MCQIEKVAFPIAHLFQHLIPDSGVTWEGYRIKYLLRFAKTRRTGLVLKI